MRQASAFAEINDRKLIKLKLISSPEMLQKCPVVKKFYICPVVDFNCFRSVRKMIGNVCTRNSKFIVNVAEVRLYVPGI